MQWKRKDSIRQRDFGGLLVLVDAEHALVHELNEVGSLVWSLLAEQQHTQQIVQRMIDTFDVSEQEARIDVEQFLQRLTQIGLIEPVASHEQGVV